MRGVMVLLMAFIQSCTSLSPPLTTSQWITLLGLTPTAIILP